MIVSIGLFTIVALVAVGALLKIIDANKKAHTLETSINNLNFALEAMSREMRVGSNYYCLTGTASLEDHFNPINDDDGNLIRYKLFPPQGCGTTTGGPWTIAFISSDTSKDTQDETCNLAKAYDFTGTDIRKAEQEDCESNSMSFATLISTKDDSDDSINVNAGKFDSFITFSKATVRVVTGEKSPTEKYPSYAQFHFVGSAGVKEKSKTLFDMQTTVSQRIRD